MSIVSGEAALLDAFETFERSVFRLEQRPVYDVPGEAERVRAFVAGDPEPACGHDEWAREIAASVAAGKDWCRVHIVDELTGYMRWKIHASRKSAAAGYRTYLVDRDADPALGALNCDFYLFDDRRVFVLVYDDQGRPVAAVDRSDYLSVYQNERDTAVRVAVPLDEYAARHRELLSV